MFDYIEVQPPQAYKHLVAELGRWTVYNRVYYKKDCFYS